jgi:hypothetical protein
MLTASSVLLAISVASWSCGYRALPDPGLAALLACHDRAVGGSALRAMPSVQYDLEITEPKFTVRGTYLATRSGVARIDVFAGAERVFSEGWDGTAGWQLPRGATESIPTSTDGAAALRHGLEQPGHLWTLADMPRNGHHLQWAEPDSGDAGKARVVKLTLQDGFETWYGVDPNSCLIIWSRNFRAFHPDVDPARKWTETRFTDFRSREGVTRPWLSLNIDLATGDTIGRTRIVAIRTPGG